MSDRARQLIAFIIAMGMVIAVASAPTLGQVAEEAIEIAAAYGNADKVDGRHAVGSGASKAKRARKLVATNASGRLPSNIVKPYWGAIKNKPPGFADGVDDVGTGYTSFVKSDTFSVGAVPVSVGVTEGAGTDTEAQMLPIGIGDEVIVTEQTYKRIGGDWITHWYRVERHPSSPSPIVQFKVRVRVFNTGIVPVTATPAALKKAAKNEIEVKVIKRRN